ncbi:hypothetical protein TREMEDRAFT_66094 [Tremella mesenterica DSM 1558]|uniref:uncharacterized protein n=1 Tax=Tremella mesenterica (strain ATCC 24925 / CBS 8224 / DSM 1558 / NBRC 9311 / NRRL Y-6157 / RJB 2259-6 / UBC 559-6) TaxID=578456 RepID=UPI00032CC55E|nr:uncharacterized protein TREMEDRAFT_66094 [Tremella mesenterica DSM 1558]EIW66000.1 hypothetical protein TREMEDRAFT_66094 [Tremella mesenterica DSM 1558]
MYAPRPRLASTSTSSILTSTTPSLIGSVWSDMPLSRPSTRTSTLWSEGETEMPEYNLKFDQVKEMDYDLDPPLIDLDERSNFGEGRRLEREQGDNGKEMSLNERLQLLLRKMDQAVEEARPLTSIQNRRISGQSDRIEDIDEHGESSGSGLGRGIGLPERTSTPKEYQGQIVNGNLSHGQGWRARRGLPKERHQDLEREMEREREEEEQAQAQSRMRRPSGERREESLGFGEDDMEMEMEMEMADERSEESPPTPPPRIINPYLNPRRVSNERKGTPPSQGNQGRIPSRAAVLQASTSKPPTPPPRHSALENFIANHPSPPRLLDPPSSQSPNSSSSRKGKQRISSFEPTPVATSSSNMSRSVSTSTSVSASTSANASTGLPISNQDPTSRRLLRRPKREPSLSIEPHTSHIRQSSSSSTDHPRRRVRTPLAGQNPTSDEIPKRDNPSRTTSNSFKDDNIPRRSRTPRPPSPPEDVPRRGHTPRISVSLNEQLPRRSHTPRKHSVDLPPENSAQFEVEAGSLEVRQEVDLEEDGEPPWDPGSSDTESSRYTNFDGPHQENHPHRQTLSTHSDARPTVGHRNTSDRSGGSRVNFEQHEEYLEDEFHPDIGLGTEGDRTARPRLTTIPRHSPRKSELNPSRNSRQSVDVGDISLPPPPEAESEDDREANREEALVSRRATLFRSTQTQTPSAPQETKSPPRNPHLSKTSPSQNIPHPHQSSQSENHKYANWNPSRDYGKSETTLHDVIQHRQNLLRPDADFPQDIQVRIAMTPMKDQSNLSTMPTPHPPGAWGVRFTERNDYLKHSDKSSNQDIQGRSSDSIAETRKDTLRVIEDDDEGNTSIHRIRISPKKSPIKSISSEKRSLLPNWSTSSSNPPSVTFSHFKEKGDVRATQTPKLKKEEIDENEIVDTSFTRRLTSILLNPLSLSSPSIINKHKQKYNLPTPSQTLQQAQEVLSQAAKESHMAQKRVEDIQRKWLEVVSLNGNMVGVVKKSWGRGTWLWCIGMEVLLIWGVLPVTLDYATSSAYLASLDPFHPSSHIRGLGTGLSIPLPSTLSTFVIPHRGSANFFDLLERVGVWTVSSGLGEWAFGTAWEMGAQGEGVVMGIPSVGWVPS